MRLLALASLLLFVLSAMPATATDAVPDVDLQELPCEAWQVGWYSTAYCTVGGATFGCTWKTYQEAEAVCLLPTPCPTDFGATVDLGTAYAGTDGCVVVAGTRSESAAPCRVETDASDADPASASCSWGSVFGYDGVSCTVQGRDPVVATCTPDAPCFVADFWTEGFPFAGAWNNGCTYGAWAGTGGFQSPCLTTLSDPGTTTCTVGRYTLRCTTGTLYGAYCTNDALACSRLPGPYDLGVATVTADTCRAGVVLDQEGIDRIIQSLLPATPPASAPDCTTTIAQQGCTVHLGGRDATVLCGPVSIGYSCVFGGDGIECTQAEWGIRTSLLTVGGGHGCHAMVQVHGSTTLG